MRRFTRNFLFRNLFLFCLIFALLGCATTRFTKRVGDAATSPSPSPATTLENAQDQSDAINRPTSKPYTGELSIFEDPKRDEKLQPDRIMDILGIKEGSNVADIGAGTAGHHRGPRDPALWKAVQRLIGRCGYGPRRESSPIGRSDTRVQSKPTVQPVAVQNCAALWQQSPAAFATAPPLRRPAYRSV